MPLNEKYIPERLPPPAQQAIKGTSVAAAERVARRCHEAIRPDQAREFAAEKRTADRRAGYFAVNRVVRPLEETALREWAEANGLMLDGAILHGVGRNRVGREKPSTLFISMNLLPAGSSLTTSAITAIGSSIFTVWPFTTGSSRKRHFGLRD